MEGSYVADQNTIDTDGQDYLTFQNLNVQGGDRSILINSSNNVIVDACSLAFYCGGNGVFILDGDNNEVKNNEINFQLIDISAITHRININDGVIVYSDSDNNLVHDNIITNSCHAGVNIENLDVGETATGNLVYLNTITSPNSNYNRGFVVSGNVTGRVANNKIYRNYIKDTNIANQLHGDNNEFTYNIINTVN